MANEKKLRLNGVARELNVGAATIIEFLEKKGVAVSHGPSTTIDDGTYNVIVAEFGKGKNIEKVNIREKIKGVRESVSLSDVKRKDEVIEGGQSSENDLLIKDNTHNDTVFGSTPTLSGPKILGHIDLDKHKHSSKEKSDSGKRVEPDVKKQAKKVQDNRTSTKNTKQHEVTTKSSNQVIKEEQKKEVSIKPDKQESTKVQPSVKHDSVKPVVVKPEEAASVEAAKLNQATPSDIETKTFDERQAENTSNLYRHGNSSTLSGPKIVGKIDLNAFEKKKSEPSSNPHDKKNRRKRIRKDGKIDVTDPKVASQGANRPAGQNAGGNNPRHNNNRPAGAGGNNANRPAGAGAHNQNRPAGAGGNNANRPAGAGGNQNRPGGNNQNRSANSKFKPKAPAVKVEITDEDVQKQIKDTLARLTSKGNKTKSSKYRRDKREAVSQRMSAAEEREAEERNMLQLTEFVTVSDLAKMMDVQVTEVITACMNLGLMVSINQRLDAEALVIVAEEFGFKCEFVSVDIQESITTDEDKEEDMLPRSPIVTVMGHVDHGKTSLLDFIRKANVIEGEAGGITQHIGAYSVKMDDGRRITFLDTPGHEAFTAMRARGASVTDVAIIIIAADDSVMPQTIEAINHASAAGVPIVFAINKIDKDGANADRIREQLGAMNYLVEDWGGKYQCQEISAKKGINVDLLLEKVLLEAELLDLKANPDRKASGVIIESSLDKGRGYMSTVLVQGGTLKVGDTVLSGIYTGRVKAMFNERGAKVATAKPATPVLVLGLNGAPQAGDSFNVMDDDKSARDLANKREQLQRMQGLKTQKHITLDEIGRRIAIGNFQELNVIVKGDVDGSVEALTDSLIKQSKDQVQVNVIHKAVGQISESDVLLAAASNAVIIGFQVRPSSSARKLAEKEEIEIRLYSIIYDAINDIKDAIEGMLAPEFREEIVCSVEIMEVFKVTKVGTIAGCLVREGKIKRDTKIRIIRDGIVVYTGKLASLKRYKDDAKEVVMGLECGLNIDGYNDIKIGDIIEGYDEIEIKRKS